MWHPHLSTLLAHVAYGSLFLQQQAFDMSFFEEIEDLKYKYAQAVQQNKRYESRYGRMPP